MTGEVLSTQLGDQEPAVVCLHVRALERHWLYLASIQDRDGAHPLPEKCSTIAPEARDLPSFFLMEHPI
ncbi:hypothetical protein [Nonomuraea helvata]|uniref:Uncharacterized protein n=1 Tax=Nonomuraea helvata TaxID=37484 RepID=A0ABV5S333_9ACTN